jgi:hypothetical protein
MPFQAFLPRWKLARLTSQQTDQRSAVPVGNINLDQIMESLELQKAGAAYQAVARLFLRSNISYSKFYRLCGLPLGRDKNVLPLPCI